MTIGVCTLEFHLPACRSLKEKRRFLNSLRSRISNKFNVAISEIEHHDLWQRATVGVVSVGVDRQPLDKMFQKVLREAERQTAAELISVHVEFL